MYHAKNGTVTLASGTMDYIRFGIGAKHLLMLPGLGDSLRSMKGTALPMAVLYRAFAKEFTVWAFSRKEPLETDCTTRSMARDQAEAMDVLGIANADIFGVSMGGMIAQWLAIDHPHLVGKLILAVTAARPNPVMEEAVGEWWDCAERNDHAAFMERNLYRIYSEGYYRRNRWLVPILGALTKPKSYDRFFLQARAVLGHDAYEQLHRIRAGALVIGGEQDRALGGEPSREIAGRIPGAELRMYPQWGHGVYEEAADFNDTVLEFLRR